MSETQIFTFRDTVWQFYNRNQRTMPWRENPSPYWVMLSEIMLQQTQVERVRPKFAAFVEEFPDVQHLARAPLSEVLRLWSGLGYNRRAKFLWQAARMIEQEYQGEIPRATEALQALPGIGTNTAGAIMAYAYNEPVVFVETNIRTVYFHHFFGGSREVVHDATLREMVAQTLDRERPRQWYWALMDYGTHLKRTAGGRLTQSHHYKKQSPLKGSLREMRGRILKVLLTQPLELSELRAAVDADERFEPALAALTAEGLIKRRGSSFGLTDH